jgi:hypothetical protein
LRRAFELADGWIPFGLPLDALGALLADGAVAAAREEREVPLDVVLAPEPPLDPLGEPETAAATVRAYGDVGATALALRFRHASRAHYVEQLEAMMEVAATADRR